MSGIEDKNFILTMDVSTIAKKIRNKEIRSSEAVMTFVNHLKKVNKQVLLCRRGTICRSITRSGAM